MKRNLKITYTLEKCDRVVFKKFLHDHDLTATEFAKRLGITHAYLCMILQGKRDLTEELLRELEKQGLFFVENFNTNGVIR